ncbi:hypothetical protein ACQEV4_13285 [Streptomyces shenzhenensis]|uniref:hypothetical protein n=1 Tax=Streptomyces shenzhenensis TaxID=943815 RepID=UPI003D8A89D6
MTAPQAEAVGAVRPRRERERGALKTVTGLLVYVTAVTGPVLALVLAQVPR